MSQKYKMYVLEDLPGVRLLLEIGVDVATEDNFGTSVAARNGYIELVQVLIDAGADVKSRNSEVIWQAAHSANSQVVQLLIKFGVKNNKLFRATSHDRCIVMELLVVAGAYM